MLHAGRMCRAVAQLNYAVLKPDLSQISSRGADCTPEKVSCLLAVKYCTPVAHLGWVQHAIIRHTPTSYCFLKSLLVFLAQRWSKIKDKE